MQQLLDDVLDILADITCFGQRGGIGHGKWHIQQASQCLGQQGLAATCRSNQQNVGFTQLDAISRITTAQTLVVVVNRYRQHLLRMLLPDDIVIQMSTDLVRSRQGTFILARHDLTDLFADDVVAQIHAFIANVDRRTGDQFTYFMLTLPAKRAVQQLAVVAFTFAFICHS